MRRKTLFNLVAILAVMLALVSSTLAIHPAQAQEPVGTAFTYQGRLSDGGSPANGTYDFEFRLYCLPDDPGSQVGDPVAVDDQAVSNGLFTVQLDFQAVFDGEGRYLEIRVRPGSSTGEYTVLSPRQELTPAPYALYALDVATHNHWGESWSGTGSGTGLTLTSSGGDAIKGLTNGITGYAGVMGKNSGTGYGIFGQSDGGVGVAGSSNSSSDAAVYGSNSGSGPGIEGRSGSGNGVYGRTNSPSGYAGVYGHNDGSGYGVYGYSSVGTSVYGLTTSGTGVRGESSSGYGVRGYSLGGDGIYGESSSATSAGVWGFNQGGYGVRGESRTSFGVSGVSNSGPGVYGSSSTGAGVQGSSSSTSPGVYGYSGSDGPGVLGISSSGEGVHGSSSSGDGVHGSSSTGSGVYGNTSSSASAGVYGYNSSSGDGVYGSSSSGYGVYGASSSSAGYAVYGFNAAGGHAIYGTTDSDAGYAAVLGANSGSGYGVRGSSNGGQGVSGDSSSGEGVYGSSSTGYGVSGVSSSGRGIYGSSTTGYAGYFDGNVHVAGTLSKLAGSFKIDHPLDPQSQYLSHSFVESPDMMNIYNGNAILDKNGEAWVELPAWFEALNGGPEHRSEYRYQLTPIGAPGPNLYVATEITDNHFQIAGGTPGTKVSWQVTGIRHDPYAEANRIPVEEAKPAEEQGMCLYPEACDQPATGRASAEAQLPGGAE